MHIREWLLLALFAVVLGVACLLARRRRRPGSAPTRPVAAGPALMGLLVSLAALTAGGAAGCKADASGQAGTEVDKPDKPATTDKRADIRARLLSALNPEKYENDERAAGRKASAELQGLLAPEVAEGRLSKAGAERLLRLHEECVAHAYRSMASCYEPMPTDWLGWESGGGAREKACKRIAKLDELSKTGKLDPAAATKAKQAIAAGLHWLEQLRAFSAETDGAKKAALKKQILDDQIGLPDEATLEAAGFVLELFSTP